MNQKSSLREKPKSVSQALTPDNQNLVTLGGLAERYFRDDPPTSLMKLRQFAELLSNLVAAYHAMYLGERETFEDTLRRLGLEAITVLFG